MSITMKSIEHGIFQGPLQKALYGFQTGARSWLNLGVGRQRPRNSV